MYLFYKRIDNVNAMTMSAFMANELKGLEGEELGVIDSYTNMESDGPR